MSKLYMIIVMSIIAVSAHATTGFLTGSTVSGNTKICYYNVLGSTRTINIKSYGICPPSYNF